MLELGSLAPDFTLPNQNNKPVSLADFGGKWVVVYFYPKDDTPGCTQEACGFRDYFSEFTNQDIVVLGISKDTAKSHKRFSDKYSLPFTILADPDTTTIQAYGAWQQKSMFGKPYMGIQRMTVIIDPAGKVQHIFPKVTPKDHEQAVLQSILKLQTAQN